MHHDLFPRSVVADRDAQSSLPFCATNSSAHLSTHLFPCDGWNPHIPRRGDPGGLSACVSLPLTSSPSLSAPDLTTSPRGSQQHDPQWEGTRQGGRVKKCEEVRAKMGGDAGKKKGEGQRWRMEEDNVERQGQNLVKGMLRWKLMLRREGDRDWRRSRRKTREAAEKNRCRGRTAEARERDSEMGVWGVGGEEEMLFQDRTYW